MKSRKLRVTLVIPPLLLLLYYNCTWSKRYITGSQSENLTSFFLSAFYIYKHIKSGLNYFSQNCTRIREQFNNSHNFQMVCILRVFSNKGTPSLPSAIICENYILQKITAAVKIESYFLIQL